MEVGASFSSNPARDGNIIGVYQEDRTNRDASLGLVAARSMDHGKSFEEVALPLTTCGPGGLPYTRVDGGTLSIGPDGTAYVVANAFRSPSGDLASGIVAATSSDGGRTWTNAAQLIADTGPEFFNNQPSVTADPNRSGVAYVTWDRSDFVIPGNGETNSESTYLSLTVDGGRTWSTPRVIVSTDSTHATQAAVTLVNRRTGAMFVVYNEATFDSQGQFVSAEYNVIRSTNRGKSWSSPVRAAADTSVGLFDPNTGESVGSSADRPTAAIDANSDRIYVAYQGSDFSAGAYDEIELVSSSDQAATFSPARQVSRQTGLAAFSPSIAVDGDGGVEVGYYDIRTLRRDDTTTLPVSAWLAASRDGGAFNRESSLVATPFDYFKLPAGFRTLGIHQSLVRRGDDGISAYLTIVNSGSQSNPTDVVRARPTIG